MEVSELSALRQVPPPGPFTLDDLKLEEPSDYVNFRFGFAIIDWIRVKDLVRGEALAGQTKFARRLSNCDSEVAVEG